MAEKQAVPFNKIAREDASLLRGSTIIERNGVNGTRTMIYKVVLTDGQQTDKRLIASVITTGATDEVTLIGTGKPAPPPPPPQEVSQCDPNYTGCVPIASDVDCAGGKGNGPAYVRGPVTVTGSDIYGLDGDGDGIGCER
jgi:hypothetical protein